MGSIFPSTKIRSRVTRAFSCCQCMVTGLHLCDAEYWLGSGNNGPPVVYTVPVMIWGLLLYELLILPQCTMN